jgi:hypothetical protein
LELAQWSIRDWNSPNTLKVRPIRCAMTSWLRFSQPLVCSSPFSKCISFSWTQRYNEFNHLKALELITRPFWDIADSNHQEQQGTLGHHQVSAGHAEEPLQIAGWVLMMG